MAFYLITLIPKPLLVYHRFSLLWVSITVTSTSASTSTSTVTGTSISTVTTTTTYTLWQVCFQHPSLAVSPLCSIVCPPVPANPPINPSIIATDYIPTNASAANTAYTKIVYHIYCWSSTDMITPHPLIMASLCNSWNFSDDSYVLLHPLLTPTPTSTRVISRLWVISGLVHKNTWGCIKD